MAASGQICWPRPGSYMAATGQDLMAADNRRQGGHRAGSSGFTYRLSSQGRRVLGQAGRGARWEPSERWTLHTLACSELSVRLREAERTSEVKAVSVTHEPDNWRRFVGRHGALEHLKPDLLVEVTTVDAWELRWFVEVDRGTEHLPTILRKMPAVPGLLAIRS